MIVDLHTFVLLMLLYAASVVIVLARVDPWNAKTDLQRYIRTVVVAFAPFTLAIALIGAAVMGVIQFVRTVNSSSDGTPTERAIRRADYEAYAKELDTASVAAAKGRHVRPRDREVLKTSRESKVLQPA